MTEINYQKGLDALKSKNFSDAIIHFSNSLDINISSSKFHNRGFAYYQIGKYNNAKEDFENAIEITLNNLSKIDKKDFKTQDLYIRDLIDDYNGIAQIYAKTNDLESAIDVYTEVINLNNKIFNKTILSNNMQISNILFSRAKVYLNLNMFEEAIEDMGVAYIKSTSIEFKQNIIFTTNLIGKYNDLKFFIENY